jgi:hypothetical protein
MTHKKNWTVSNTLTVMAVAFAAIGFVKTSFGIPAELEYLKVACLIVVHACFSWRLTRALGRFLDLRVRKGRKWKARAAATLMAFYFGVDLVLVHTGLGWVFNGWLEIALYLASAGFTAVNLLGDWVDEEDEPDPAALTAARPDPPRLPAPPVQSEEIRGLLIGLEEAKARLKAAQAA